MTEEVLNIGDVKVLNHAATFTCYGLGSCVGLFIKDRSTGITSGAHIFMPVENDYAHQSKKYTPQQAITAMLEEMKRMGSNLQNLRAKFVGGSNLLKTTFQVGAQNADAVKKYLIQNRIFIAASDTGGNVCRTVRFNTHTEALLVTVPLYQRTKIL